MKTHSFQLLPGFRFRVDLFFHPTYRAASAQFRKTYPKDKEGFDAVTLTIDPHSDDHPDLLAQIIFYRDGFTVPVAAHEAAHVGLHFVRSSGLEPANDSAEELYAEAVESCLEKILAHKPKGW